MVKRYSILVLGLLVCAFGVAFVTKASLGTSPIAAIPYSLSLIFPVLSLGNWTIVFCCVLILLQIVLLRRDCKWGEMLVQLVISFVFGYCIDFAMICIQGFAPEAYGLKILSLLMGCVILAFGAYLELIADVAMLPVDAFERTVAQLLGCEYPKIRTRTDLSMALIGAVLCLVFLGKLVGVREGTLLVALITGNIVKIFVKKLRPLTQALGLA